jgi:DNA-binding transcriptional MerR regulator
MAPLVRRLKSDNERSGSMDKSPDAFRTISEVAEGLDLPQHVLRFWESRFPQIKPLKRGGGRRYYRPDDVELLRAIKHLLYDEGYTIKGVQRLFKEQGARALTGAAPSAADAPPAEAALAGEAGERGSEPIEGAQTFAQSFAEELDVLRLTLAELAECERILATVRGR